MQAVVMLGHLERVESEMAALYEWFSEVFASDEEISGFFFRMSMQERSHRNLVRMGKRLAQSSSGRFESVEGSEPLFEEFFARMASFRTEHSQPSVVEALAFALECEGAAAERLHRQVIKIANPEMKQLLNQLADEDREHLEALRRLARDRSRAGPSE